MSDKKKPTPPKRVKATELNQKQKTFCDLVVAGYPQYEAYGEAYENSDKSVCNAGASRLMKNKLIKDYIESRRQLMGFKYDVTKESLIRDLVNMREHFNNMFELANKDELTKNEEKRFNRLARLLKGSDINKINEQLAKLTGANEPDQVNVSQEWVVNFGTEDTTRMIEPSMDPIFLNRGDEDEDDF